MRTWIALAVSMLLAMAALAAWIEWMAVVAPEIS